MRGKLAGGKAGMRLAKICIGAGYYFLIMKPVEILAKIIGRPNDRLVILCYHGVGSEDRSNFAWQMDELMRAARPVALDRLMLAYGNGNLVAVTFDDGFASIQRNALPELEERSIPATIFVPTANLGTRPMWTMEKDDPYHEERILEADELRVLAGPIVGFGSHSDSHADLTIMTKEQILRELSRSKGELEEILGTPVDLFAVPYGRYPDRVSELARMAGYRKVFTMDPDTVRPDDPRILVGRIRVDPYDWKIEFWLKVRGAYKGVAPFYRLKRIYRDLTRSSGPYR